jgi:hypothetical protein
LSPVNAEVEEHIRLTAVNTDKLIVRLDTLTNRIDTARANENRELVEYYERQFEEASVEFMDGVESILDGWYALRGEDRPSAQVEYIAPQTLEEIHNAVVSIVRGLPFELSETPQPNPIIDSAQGVNILRGSDFAQGTGASKGSRHKVDVTG